MQTEQMKTESKPTNQNFRVSLQHDSVSDTGDSNLYTSLIGNQQNAAQENLGLPEQFENSYQPSQNVQNAISSQNKLEMMQRRSRNNQILINFSILVCLQLMLIFLIMEYFLYNLKNYPEYYIFWYPDLVIMSFICCTLNHLAMQPRVYSGIERLIFIKNHIDRFETPIIPIGICLMKFSVEILVEIV